MAEPTYDIDIGTAFSMSLVCLDENRDPVDLTGYTTWANMAPLHSSIEDDYTLNLDPTIPTPANGTVVINKITTGVAAGQYAFDIWIQASGGTPIKIGFGTVKMKKALI